MNLDRRQFLAAGSACLASCGAGARLAPPSSGTRLDALFDAHAHQLPERVGAGANHYPMAAEALEALGYGDAIDESWIVDAERYAGVLGRAGAIEDDATRAAALGHYERYGDWLDLFRAELKRESWRPVVAEWTPRLAPALCAAAYHGVIRTGHAVRALRQHDTPARRNELAAGLAYWAARYVELPTVRSGAHAEVTGTTADSLASLPHPWLEDRSDVDFFGVVERMTREPVAPPVADTAWSRDPRESLQELVHAAATGFLEMLVLERHRIWLLHTVTGPAAVEWLLPEVDTPGAQRLVAYARQSVEAMFVAYGESFTPREHVRAPDALSGWPALVERAASAPTVHGVKLIDALVRFDREGDPLWRSVAEQFFEWV